MISNNSLYNIKGLALPKVGTLNEILSTVDLYATINSNLRIILGTRLGEVPGVPTFGSRLFNLVHELNNDVTQSLAALYIKEDIYAWENRITIRNIQFTVEDSSSINCNIYYTIKIDPTGKLQTLNMVL